MGVKIGGGILSYSFVGTTEPSGRLQIFEPKDFPYLNTGKSLVFVIARNGMVWGKKLDEQSSKGDIELEVFWPRDDGCLVRQWGSMREWGGEGYGSRLGSTPQYTLPTAIKTLNVSVEQNRKIESILSQKEIIQYELGTLMVKPCPPRSHINCSHLMEYRRVSTEHIKCMLQFPVGEPCNIKVVDCSYGKKEQTTTNVSWNFYYDNAAIDFKFFSGDMREQDLHLVVGTPENPVGFAAVQNLRGSFYNGSDTVIKTFFASRLSERKFDMSGARLHNDVKINPRLRIMYGEYDFFEYFEVDDAVLVLEEETISAGPPKLFWTLGIAKNKHVREMMRLASNNPDLFAPLIPK